MEVKQMRHFEAICRCGSFAKAAQDCYISAQGISLSINRLEDEIGCRVFERTQQGIILTDAGSYLLPKAEQVLRILDECAEHFSGGAGGLRSVSVMLVRGTVERFARKPIELFKEHCPDVPLHLHVGSDKECEKTVMEGSADVGMCAGPVDTQALNARRVYSGRNVLIVNESHPFCNKASISVSDLRGVPIAIMNGSMNSTRALFELAKRSGIILDYSYIDDPRLAVYMAEMGLRCGVINSISAGKLCTGRLRAIPFEDEEMNWDVFLITRKGDSLTTEAKVFRNAVVSCLN